jgi:hypothetical protein
VETLAVPVQAPQLEVAEDMEDERTEGWVIEIKSTSEHPFESITVTFFTPWHNPVIEEVVLPVDHEKV